MLSAPTIPCAADRRRPSSLCSCEVFIEAPMQSPVKVATLAAGHSFGELALMYSAPRAATVTAKIQTAVWTITGQLFRSVLQRGAVEQ